MDDPLSRYSVHDFVIYRDTGRCRVTLVVLERWNRAVRADEIFDQHIYLAGRHPGFDAFTNHIQRHGGYAAGATHNFNFFTGLQLYHRVAFEVAMPSSDSNTSSGFRSALISFSRDWRR